VDLKLVNASFKNTVPKRFLSEIIESRLAEIFSFAERELKRIGKSGNLPGGVVLTGGGAKLPGILHLAKEELRLAPQIGLTEADFKIMDAEYKTELEDPEFVAAVGLALWGAEFSGKEHAAFKVPLSGNQLISFIRAFFKNLMP
jgi:cell division protein FtsA